MIVVYGPYENATGRKHVIHYDNVTGRRRTQSYARFLMEQYLGRKLTVEEQVDHVDGDFTNDNIQNLQILTPSENMQKQVKQSGRSIRYYQFICPVCQTPAQIDMRQYRHNQIANGRAGPYCSKSCAGKAHH